MELFIIFGAHAPTGGLPCLCSPHMGMQFGCTKRQHTVVVIYRGSEASRADKDLIELLEHL